MQSNESFFSMLGHRVGMDLSQTAIMRDRMASGVRQWESITGHKVNSPEFQQMVDEMAGALLR